MILGIQQDLKSEGIKVTISQLCRWFEVPRRTAYYKPCKAPPKVQERFEAPIKAMIDQDPSFGYRTVAGLLKFNKNTVQRIFQIRGWQVKQRPIGFRPRVQAMPSVAKSPDERWATDLCRVWTGRDGWASLAVVIDCYTREILGWHLSRSAKSSTAESALGASLDQPLWHAWRGDGAVSAEKRQRIGVHKPQLHPTGQELRFATRIHHAALPRAKRVGGESHSNDQGAVCSPAKV